MTAHKLNLGDHLSLFFRSFFIQSLWTFRLVQNAGWLFAFWPVIRRLAPDNSKRSEMAHDHMGFFSTHPYFANTILGVIAKEEQERHLDQGRRREEILAAKRFMSGPLAALGETLFWATLRPVLAVVALVAGGWWANKSWWVVPLLFLGMYNFFHISVRLIGQWAGFRWGTQVVTLLVGINIQKWVQGLFLLGLGTTFGALGAFLFHWGPDAFVGGIFLLVSGGALLWGISPSLILFLSVVSSILYGMF